jgi:hypothetical protein
VLWDPQSSFLFFSWDLGSQAGLPHGLPWSKPNFFHKRRIKVGDELALHRLGGLIPTGLAQTPSRVVPIHTMLTFFYWEFSSRGW